MFLIPSLTFLKKILLVSKYEKQICYKRNKFLFFGVTKDGQIFPSKVSHFQYNHRFFFSREMGKIGSSKEPRLQKLIKSRFSG